MLEYLIGLVPEGRAELSAQAATARVVGTCPCGCGTFDLVVDESAPAAGGLGTPAADAVGGTAERPLDVLLFAPDGRLACVEVVHYVDDAPDQPLPAPDELEQAQWSDRDEHGVRRLLNERR